VTVNQLAEEIGMKNAHPEQGPDEHWVGNTLLPEWPPSHLRCLSTARIGNVAYDIDGKKLNPNYHRPLFIGDSEYEAYDRIMMARFSAASRTQPRTPTESPSSRPAPKPVQVAETLFG
jgi:hypothetical protein